MASSDRGGGGEGAQTLPPKFLQQNFNAEVPHFESLCRIFRQPILLHKELPDVGRTSHLLEGACDSSREARANWSRAPLCFLTH